MNKKGKSAVIYTGYAAEYWAESVDEDRVEYLKYLGYDNVICEAIDYDSEWEYDECRSMLLRQLKLIKNVDLIIGFSLWIYRL